MLLQRHEAVGRIDLSPQRCFLDCRDHHVAAQGQIGGFQLKAVCVLVGLRRLIGASGSTEDVRQIAHAQLRRVQVVGGIGRHGRRRVSSNRVLGPRPVDPTADAGQQVGPLCQIQFVGLAQSGLGRIHVRVCPQRLLDQLIELRRPEQRPPLFRNRQSRDQLLRI